MGKKSKAPAPPDPYKTAQADAEFNRLNVYGPQGIRQQFGFTDDAGNFVAGPQPQGKSGAVRMFETPFDASMRDKSEAIGSSLGDRAVTLAGALGAGAQAPTAEMVAGMPRPDAPTDAGLPGRAEASDATRAAAESALFERSASLMRPEIARQDRGLQGRLQAMGIPIGSEAFNDTYGDFTTKTGDMWSRLAMDSVIGGGQEQSRDYALKADARARAQGEQDRSFNYGNAVRDAAIGDAASFYDMANNQRGRDLGELAAMLGGSYTPAPTVGGPSGANRIDVAGNINSAYQGQLANHQAQQQANAGMWGSLASLGGAGLLAFGSSRKIKVDLGEVENDVAIEWIERMPIRAWKYREGTPHRDEQVHIGPFAEDFHEITDASTDEAIFGTDPAGVALAGAKALLARVRELEARIEQLEAA